MQSMSDREIGRLWYTSEENEINPGKPNKKNRWLKDNIDVVER